MIHWTPVDVEYLLAKSNKFHENMYWYSIVRDVVLTRFGQDVGTIIMEYCNSIQLEVDAESP